QLSAMLGDRRGEWLHRRLRGIDDSAIEAQHVARSISRDETFARDIHDDAALRTQLRILIRRLAGDVRGDGLRARTITVRIRDSDFRTRQAAHTVKEAIETDVAMLAVALPLLARLRSERRTPARLLGVAASNFVDPGESQIALFDDESRSLETERDRRLARASDQVRRKFGRDALGPGDMIDS